MNEMVASIADLEKRYDGRAALAGVSLGIAAGECLALVGHNGAGKSTLIRSLLGFVRPDAGAVQVLGRSPDAADGARARGLIGYLPENIAFDPGMTGHEIMRFYARLKGLRPDAGLPLLEKVGLAEAAGRRVRGYSKGMRQRLGIAQALLGAPRLLLLDEPTTGLDPEARALFYRLIFEAKQRGQAVLLSSHALGEIEREADRVAILAQGQLLAIGSISDIREAADLPIRIEVAIRHCHSASVIARLPDAISIANDHPERLTIACRPEDKLPMLRALLACGDSVCDIAIAPPSLEAIYAGFHRGGIGR